MAITVPILPCRNVNELVSFYESLGFAVTSEPYDDYGLSHVDMALVPTPAPRERVDGGDSPRTGEGEQG